MKLFLQSTISTTLLCFALGACGPSDPENRAEQAPEPKARQEAPAGNPPRNVYSVIAEKRRELLAVPGRTGILAEKRRYSAFDEELIIRDFFQDREDGFFLDVGCAWPVQANNTYYLEKHLGWTGIGIDALVDYAPLWQQKRPTSKFFSFLVTDRSDVEKSFFKSQNKGLSSTSQSAARGGQFGMNLETTEIKVASITLNDLLDREGVTKIDLLSMDIEGHELPALEGFDIQRFKPDLVVIENGRGLVLGYFVRNGYELIDRYLPFDSVNAYFKPVDPPGEPKATQDAE